MVTFLWLIKRVYFFDSPDTWRRKTPFKQKRLDFYLVSDSIQDNIQFNS